MSDFKVRTEPITNPRHGQNGDSRATVEWYANGEWERLEQEHVKALASQLHDPTDLATAQRLFDAGARMTKLEYGKRLVLGQI